MQAAFRSPSAPAPRRRRSIATPNDASQQRQPFQLPCIVNSSVRRSSSKGTLGSKPKTDAVRLSTISSVSTILKSAGSSTSSLLSDDVDEHLTCMPRNLPSMLERRHSSPNLPKNVSVAKESATHRTSPKSTATLTKLSLQGREAGRPALQSRNVALIRWIFENARTRHSQRSSYQARQQDTSPNPTSGLHGIIFREVCIDILAATRNCCKAYRACQYLSKKVVKPGNVKMDFEPQRKALVKLGSANMEFAPQLKLKTSLQTKAFTVGVVCKMLQDVREQGGEAELMWKACFDGLASKSLTSKAFGDRSIALRSCRSELSMHGSASLGTGSFAPV